MIVVWKWAVLYKNNTTELKIQQSAWVPVRFREVRNIRFVAGRAGQFERARDPDGKSGRHDGHIRGFPGYHGSPDQVDAAVQRKVRPLPEKSLLLI